MPVPGKSTPTETTPQRVAPQNFDELLRSAVPSSADQDRYLVSPGHTWVYAHNPMNWEIGEVDGKPAALPVLTTIRLQPGMSLVKTQREGDEPTAYLRPAFQELLARGLKVISPDAPVPAKCAPALPGSIKVRGYIAEVPARDPATSILGTHYAERWNVPIFTPPKAPQRFRFDRAAYNRWRAHLIESGQVDAPDASVLELLEQTADSQHRRRLSAPYTTETRAMKLEESATALEAARKVRAEAVA